MLVEDSIMLILNDAPLRTEVAGEKGVPTDRELSLVGRHGRGGLIGSGELTVDERGAVGHDSSVDTEAGPGFLQMGG